MSVNTYFACSIDGAVEGGFAKIGEVVSQQVVCHHVEVVGEFREVLMVDAAGDDSLMSIAIRDNHILQFNLVGDHHHGITFQLVGGVQRGYGSLTIYNEVSCEVDVIQGASQTGITFGMACDMAQERLGEIMHELNVGTVGTDIQIDSVMYG